MDLLMNKLKRSSHSIDEKNQVITLVAWIEYQWTDYKLKWHPSEYGGIKDIRIPGNANAIWRPDVLLHNSADESFDSTYPVNYVVSHTGPCCRSHLGYSSSRAKST
ncbi:hypothetical protein KIN20_002646 [Parelaphostrongylus tenuis]|uniref:Neurotransmitter-gated ion-channel ligand-binding domain-containing protein n=1 Tax=Parelaphostrongylus tenuis TaxID=148309 RepID=A0AAD5QGW9_PARTN|nr:hypothetical protein KIN20_002646 [Parelaphostrongylus tenuis]